MVTVCIDYETIDSRGASFEYFRDDFKILSLSCAWRDKDGVIKQWFSTQHLQIRQKLVDLSLSKAKIVAHNLGFEYGVTTRCMPDINLNWHADTMRLAQLRDGGGDEFNPPELSFDQSISLELGEITEKQAKKLRYKGIGLSLEAIAKRFLPDGSMHDHKKVAHDWLEKHCGILKNHGRELHRLPHNILRDYNNADTLVTLLLYESLVEWAKKENFDWSRDHILYELRGRLMTGAYTKGIKINLVKLHTYILEIEEEIKAIETTFADLLKEELKEVERIRFAKVREFANDATLKSDTARFKRWIKVITGGMDDSFRYFNIGSSLQLQLLFMEVMNILPIFHTAKGSPSFKAAHIHQWGEGGKVLIKLKTRQLVLQQAINTYLAAQYTGRVHCSVRTAGTRTNRVAGGRDA